MKRAADIVVGIVITVGGSFAVATDATIDRASFIEAMGVWAFVLFAACIAASLLALLAHITRRK